MIHIGFDVSQTGSGKAGCGYFADAMIRAMINVAPQHRYSLFPDFGDFYFNPFMPICNPYSGQNVHYGPRHLSREVARVFWNRADIETILDMPDIIHANNFWCPTQLTSSRLIYTLYDMGFAVKPSWTTEANRVGCFDGVFRSAIVADWVVAISEASRTHYLSIFPHFPENRIRVIYPCSRFSDATSPGKRPNAVNDISPGKFWLAVGTIEPRKNLWLLIEAYARYLMLDGPPMPLVLAGGKGWLMDDFQKQLHELKIETQVVMTGYVSDEELIWLYRNCYANLYPSLFEGFGLPVLEGMQFGAPTLASSIAAISEVAADAAIRLPLEDSAAWAQAMLQLAMNKQQRDELGVASRMQANRFDREQSALKLLELYEESLVAPKRQRKDSILAGIG